jgi:hypothetical protein
MTRSVFPTCIMWPAVSYWCSEYSQTTPTQCHRYLFIWGNNKHDIKIEQLSPVIYLFFERIPNQNGLQFLNCTVDGLRDLSCYSCERRSAENTKCCQEQGYTGMFYSIISSARFSRKYMLLPIFRRDHRMEFILLQKILIQKTEVCIRINCKVDCRYWCWIYILNRPSPLKNSSCEQPAARLCNCISCLLLFLRLVPLNRQRHKGVASLLIQQIILTRNKIWNAIPVNGVQRNIRCFMFLVVSETMRQGPISIPLNSVQRNG